MAEIGIIAQFVKQRRKQLRLTQEQLAEKAGVGLRWVRELEQGKNTLRLDKVNQILSLFGYVTGPVKPDTRQGSDHSRKNEGK
ncbi:MAG TPA: helix-turn-helix transcriptional regulator [Bacteroidota bacterium]|nr:helix-turn-helix transcriptional regulator [Bacteroidota bacterium]